MRNLLTAAFSLLLFLVSSCQGSDSSETKTIEIVHTTDVHGNVFPYDFIADEEGGGSYARIYTYVDALRKSGAEVLLLDAGDILQGQPTAYYYNFVDTLSSHLMADVLNYMSYDAVTVGNHDVEPGHSAYDRWAAELKMPLLGANVIDQRRTAATDTVSYFKPYTIINRGGLRVAVLGMVTPAIPRFLPPLLWSGMEFEDIVRTAQRIMPEILAKNPDVVVALIHSGIGDISDTTLMAENAGRALAREVEGIDLVLCGHDHKQYVDSLVRPSGQTVYILNPGPDGKALSRTTLTLSRGGDGKRVLSFRPGIISLDRYVPDNGFMSRFTPQYNAVKSFVEEKVGSFTEDVDARDVFFGPSAFTDIIHEVQMSLFDSVQISLTAPLDAEFVIRKGDLQMRDLFKLYKYENGVYLMRLTGREVRDELEASYGRWVGTMTSADDHLLLLQIPRDSTSVYLPTLHPYYNFDSAMGIRYTVDVTKPVGERVRIECMADGTPFDPDADYRVVMNSYRASGGGDLLTQGAGIPPSELSSRVIATKTKDLRYYLRGYLQSHSPITPLVRSQWQFIPQEWTLPAAKRDRLYLFAQK